MIAVGTAPAKSGLMPQRLNTSAMSFSKISIHPLARNIPTATSIAMRYGIMLIAVLNPSFAPSMKVSYTLIFLTTACIVNQHITPSSTIAAIAADNADSVFWSNLAAPHTRIPTKDVSPMIVVSITGSFSFIRCAMQTAMSPTIVATYVAMSIGRKISAGFSAPSCALYAMIVVGIIVNPLAPKTTNIIIALLAFDLSVFISCSCCIALSPIGVAALSNPNIFAAIFISIDPNTGWFLGTCGNIRVKNGATPFPIVLTAPAFSPILIIPIHSARIPVKPSDSSNPVLALVKVEFSISEKICISPNQKALIIPIKTANKMSEIQI